MLRPANGVTVTLDSPVEAVLYEIFDLSLDGNVALSPGAVERVVPEWWGAGDDSTDDTDIDATDHAVAAVPNGTIAFAPGRSYTLSRTLRGAPGFRWAFNDTTFVAESSGSYDDVLDNSAVDTGFDVFFATDGGHQSIHHGRLWLDGERVPNLCGISGNTANNHSVQRSEFVVFRDFERGIYALDQSNGNTLVGHSFGTVDFRQCGTDIYLDSAGSDDLVFDVVRSHGSTLPAHAGRANITLRFACGVVMHSLFIRGQGPDRAGLSLTNRSSLVCDHLYLEGDFDTPRRVAGNRNHLWAGALLSGIAFSIGT